MKEKLWSDIKSMVENKINEQDTMLETKAQKERFQLVKVTDSFV